MAIEIEKKFLVTNDAWRSHSYKEKSYIQGYFATDPSCSIRVRLSNDQADLNIKSATLGITRTEYEYPVPVEEAREMLEHLCVRPLIEKTRHYVRIDQHLWEIDVFAGDNEGLIIAEIELKSPDESFAKPDWIGEEVSDDPRYYNVCLVSYPYKEWKA